MSQRTISVIDRIRDALLESWLDAIGWSMAELLQAQEQGIPEEWAREIERELGGRVAIDDWPRVIRPPKFSQKPRSTPRTALPARTEGGTDRAMAANPVMSAIGGSQRRTDGQLPLFHRVLYQHGLTAQAYANERKKNVQTVRSWSKAIGGRRIPRSEANYIEDRFRDKHTGETMIPADRSSWPNGIDENR